MESLKETGQFENTLIMFISDNGGCGESYGPAPWKQPGIPDEDTTYGYYLPWANASNTPFRLYKRWTHEGGISTPCIAHWPEGISDRNSITHSMGTVVDLMPTFLEVAGAEYPRHYNGYKIQPMEGESLLPVLQGDSGFSHRPVSFMFPVHRGVRDGRWELYDMQADRTELQNVIDDYLDIARQMIDSYQRWSNRMGVLDWGDQSTY